MIEPIISAIVTTKNSSNTLNDCLQSIKDQTYKKIEIIVVDNNSNDDTKKIALEYTNKVYNIGPERSAQRNYGAKAAEGEYILILDSDMVLSKNVIKSSVSKITNDAALKGLIIPEKSFGEGFWAECKKLERSFYVGIDWIEAARFFEKKAFMILQGYDLQNTGTEDYSYLHKKML